MSEHNVTRKTGDGHDPNLVGPENTHDMKLTGQGAPGSHSAVFGLTPDGHKHDETQSTTTTSKPAQSKESAVGGGSVPSDTEDASNTTSIAVTGGGVASQMHDPRVAEKGHGGQAVESEAGAGVKPGSGLGGPSQGTGEVGSNPGSSGGLLDKVKSYVSGSS